MQKKKLSSEQLVRQLFERVYFKDFTKARKPSFLKNKENRQLEFDGYNEHLKIAFEHHGTQHYKFPNKFHRTKSQFNTQKRNDTRKRNLCRRRSITLIEIPQLSNSSVLIKRNSKIYTTPYKNLISLIIFKLKKSKRRIPPEIFNTYITNDGRIKKRSRYTTLKNKYGTKLFISFYVAFGLPIFLLWMGSNYG